MAKNIGDISEFYVYVYIDPRNHEEFYYGKGKGNRKLAHSTASSNDEMANRIKEIKEAECEPIIRVIAKELTSDEALLIEKTLIWKLGKRAGSLVNVSPGYFANKFRPHDTLHEELAYFDFKNGLYLVNVSEWHQDWDDCKKLGFIAAGQDRKWSDPLKKLEPGDIVVAYIKGHGYVGIGRVIEKAVRVNDFIVRGKSLKSYSPKVSAIFKNCENIEKSDYLVKVEWIKSIDDIKDKTSKGYAEKGLFFSQQIRVSLQGKAKTISYLEKEFAVNFKNLLAE